LRGNTNRVYTLAFLLVLAGFVYGAASLFLARYERGDVYPRYSSFRADPLGTKALYESLRATPGVRAARNVEPLDRVAGHGAFTMFVNGYTFPGAGPFVMTEMPGELADSLNTALMRGARVVISFAPLTTDYSGDSITNDEFQERMEERLKRGRETGEVEKETEQKQDGNRPEKVREESIVELPTKPDEKKDEEAGTNEDQESTKDKDDRGPAYEDLMPKPVQWEDAWGVTMEFHELARDPKANAYTPETAHRAVDAPLPETVPVRTTLSFATKSDRWRTIYAVGERPVLIERPVGEGTLVLVADAFLLSNEAMRAERHPDFLAWLVGPNRAVLFDETTLGTERQRGLASLLWQYRLQGVVAALILLAALYIWKNGQPLVPPFHDTLPTDAYAYVGKDSASGFTNLLKRGVPAPQVLRTCLAEWEKSFSHRSADLAESVRDAKAIVLREDAVPRGQRDLLKAYKDICAAFAKHRLG